MEVQVRFEDGGIQILDSVKAAFELAKTESRIWKISWPEGDHRIRLVRAEEGSGELTVWLYQPIDLGIEEHEHLFSEEGWCECGAVRYGTFDGQTYVLEPE